MMDSWWPSPAWMLWAAGTLLHLEAEQTKLDFLLGKPLGRVLASVPLPLSLPFSHLDPDSQWGLQMT